MSDKRLSLEHIIRNIAEGKFTPSDQPKITLEHAIRNVHEGIGIIGSDDPAKTPTSFLTRKYSSMGGKQSTKNVQAGKGVVAKQAQADPIKMEGTQLTDMSGASGGSYGESGKTKKESAPPDTSGVTIASEDGKKKKVQEDVPNYGNAATVAQWPAAESGKKIKKEGMETMGGQNNEVGEYGRTEDGKKKIKEESDHSVYHVSWGPGLDHEVLAKHGDEAASKAKDALIAKTPKLKDPKYSDTFNKKPTVHNISKERKVQKEEIEQIVETSKLKTFKYFIKSSAAAHRLAKDLPPGAHEQDKEYQKRTKGADLALKKLTKEEVSGGTEDRRKVVAVGRPDTAKDPKDVNSKIYKQGQIKSKIIDEAEETDKIKIAKGKTPVDTKPTLKNAPVDGNTVKEDIVDEGALDKVKQAGKVLGVVGALGAHAGKTYDAANIATHTDDPGLAAATMATYANPQSRLLNMLPTAFKADKAGAGEDEYKRQQKFIRKQATQKEETEMTDETTNSLIDAFVKLQGQTGNMFEAAKKLSPKQEKIAKVAGDKSKIDAPDFAALRAGKKVEEEVEQIDEIGDTSAGRATLKSYIKKAGGGGTNSGVAHQANSSDAAPGGQLHKTSVRKTTNRVKGVERAADRLESVEEIDEISKKTYVGAMHQATDPDSDRSGSEDKIVARAKKYHGEKFAKDVEGVSKSHWGREGHTTGYDKLAHRTPARVTASGKAHKQDVAALKTRIKTKMEDVEFSDAELEYFNSVMEAGPVAKTDATNKGSFKKAGATPNGDPVRPTVPTRDLTDDVEHIEEKLTDTAKANIRTALSGKMKKTSAPARALIKLAKSNPANVKEEAIEEHADAQGKSLKVGDSVMFKDGHEQYGQIHSISPEGHAKLKVWNSDEGRHEHKTKHVRHLYKETNEEVEHIEEGRPKKNPTPETTERDPRQHIQVVAGRAAAGNVIDFHHNNGTKSKITPGMGRRITAHLNTLKPAERQSAVNKMHDSAEGLKV